jgi:hypothetical protein
MKFITAIAIILLSATILSSCTSNDHRVSDGFIDSLTEKQIGETSYYISIPNGYDIKEKEGPTSVYSISHRRTRHRRTSCLVDFTLEISRISFLHLMTVAKSKQ